MGFTYCTKKMDLGNSPLQYDIRDFLRNKAVQRQSCLGYLRWSCCLSLG